MKIAIIDDGVNRFHFRNIDNLTNYRVTNDQMVEYSPKSTAITHGTICAAIIQKNVDFEIEIISYKVKEYTKAGYVIDMKTALESCIQHNIDIVNVSVGSLDYEDCEILQPIINKMIRRSMIVVAAMGNNGKAAYPAMCENVIKVQHNERVIRKINLLNEEKLLLETNSIHKLMMQEGVFTTKPCNSYATPYVSACIANMINQDGKTNLAETVKKCSFNEK